VTFLDALKSERPMRRTSTFGSPPWLTIGEKQSGGGWRHPWLRLDTGEEVTLTRFDYLAEDWEVMP
jgi:hypothetical protein